MNPVALLVATGLIMNNLNRNFKIFIFLILVTATVKSQTNIQKKIFLPGSYTANSKDVIETTPNNFVIIGTSLDSVGSQFHKKLTMIGTDQNGNMTWRKTYGNNNFSYTQDLFSTGMIIKSHNFLYSAIMVADSNTKLAGVFLKYNYTGDTIWQRKFYELNSDVYFNHVAPSVDNGFLITGAIQTNTPTFNNHPTVALYILKTDINGNKLWDKKIYKSNLDHTQFGRKIIQDSVSKRIIVVGEQSTTNQYSNILILDSLGNVLTQMGSNGILGSGFNDLIPTKDGNFVACGSYNYPNQFINGLPTQKAIMVKFNIEGGIIFNNQYDTLVVGNWFTNLAELPNGDLVANGVLHTLFQHGLGLNGILRILKVDANGTLQWKKYFDNYLDNGNEDVSAGLCLSSDGSLVFSSWVASGEPDPHSYMFYKTDTTFCDGNSTGCYSYVGIKENEIIKLKIKCLPNPATNSCMVSLGEFRGYKNVTIELRNILGQTLYNDNINNMLYYVLNTENYSEGVYIISISENNQPIAEQKLIILK